MKRLLPLLLLFFYGSIGHAQEYKEMIEAGTFKVQEIQQSAKQYFDVHGTGKGSGFVQFKRWEYFALKSMDTDGYLKDPGFYYDELQRFNQELNTKSQNSITSLNDNWTEMGPTNWNETSGWNSGVGRLTSAAIHPTDANTIIAGSLGGGIWKTTNKGTTWQPLTDNHGNMYVYSLAIDPQNTNHYYWGSSSGRVYKSTDGGATWSQIGSASNGRVIKIIIHPTNANILLAAVRYRGIYRSTNGGTSWTKVAGSTGFDVEFDPNNSSIVFASGNNMYRSTDTGATFTQISGFGNEPKMIGVTAADSNRVYVVEANESGGTFRAFYQSNDNGVSFTSLSHTGMNYFGYESDASDTEGQAPRDMAIAVSQTDKDEVHIAGIMTWRSTNGGTSFTCTSFWTPGGANSRGIGYCHADVDDMVFQGGKLYVVSDGGIFIAENPGTVNTSYYTDLTSGMGIRQFYLMGISQSNPVVISAGAQDNGTSALQASGNWVDWLGADGFESIVDVNNNNTLYGTIYYGTMYKSTNQGNSRSSVSKPDTGNWVTPLEQDSSGALYFGGETAFKSTNGGTSWNAISQNFGNKLDQLKIAPSNHNIMYASYGANLYKTTTGSGTWSAVTGFSGSINSIAIHPTDPNKVALATTASSRVYLTTDGGATWSAYGTGLPSFSAYALVWDNNGRDGLYLGMNYGIYYRDNTFSSWQTFNNNLPNVRVTELEINYVDNNIYTCTYGRGIWRSPRFDPNVLSTVDNELNKVDIYPNPAYNTFFVHWDQPESVSVRVFNVEGRLMYYRPEVNLTQPLSITTSSFESGVYFVRVNSSKGVLTKKLIVR